MRHYHRCQHAVHKEFHSRANLEHLYFLLSKLPLFWDVYGNQVKNNVAMFTPYAAQRGQYLSVVNDLRRQGSKDGDGWKDGDLPTVLTVDQAGGHEYTLSIVD